MFDSVNFQLGGEGSVILDLSALPDDTRLLEPRPDGSVRTMDTCLSDFPSEPRSESFISRTSSVPGSSVHSFASHMSEAKLPLTSQGYFSDPDNFDHFFGMR